MRLLAGGQVSCIRFVVITDQNLPTRMFWSQPPRRFPKSLCALSSVRMMQPLCVSGVREIRGDEIVLRTKTSSLSVSGTCAEIRNCKFLRNKFKQNWTRPGDVFGLVLTTGPELTEPRLRSQPECTSRGACVEFRKQHRFRCRSICSDLNWDDVRPMGCGSPCGVLPCP